MWIDCMDLLSAELTGQACVGLPECGIYRMALMWHGWDWACDACCTLGDPLTFLLPAAGERELCH